MGKVCVRLFASLLVCAAGMAFVTAPAADALLPPAHASSFVGTYACHLQGAQTITFDLQVNADGSAVAQQSNGSWSNTRRNFTLTFSFSGLVEVFTAKQTTKGLASKANPGILTVNGRPGGTWYAVKTG